MTTKTIYILHVAGEERGTYSVEAFATIDAAEASLQDVIEYYRRVFAPKRIEVNREYYDQDADANPQILVSRAIVKVLNDLGSTDYEFELTIYLKWLTFDDDTGEKPMLAWSDELPVEPGYYICMYECLGGKNEVRSAGSEICGIFRSYKAAEQDKLMATSLLFEELFPTQGDEIPRSHLTQPLENLENVAGVRLRWRRLIPETRLIVNSEEKEGE